MNTTMDTKFTHREGFDAIYETAWVALAQFELPYLRKYNDNRVRMAFSYLANGTLDSGRITKEDNLEWMCEEVGRRSELANGNVSMRRASFTSGVTDDICQFELVSPSRIQRVTFRVYIPQFRFES